MSRVKTMLKPDNSQEVIRGVAEIGLGAVPVASFAAWLRFLQELNIVLATISLAIGVLVGLHGAVRIIRSYRGR